MEWFRRRESVEPVREAARQALDGGRLDEARDGFRRLIELGVDDSSTWFNLGLVEKLSRSWQASADANRRAAELDAGNQEAHWNLGVAATALRDWPTARWAWRRLGLEVGDEEPPTADFGPAPVRLNATPDGGGEVVWGQRIDPCRVRIKSVPLPECGHRFGDVVLHDVVPRGERRVGSTVLAVFDELERMEPSDLPTLEVGVRAATPADLDALLGGFVDAGFGAEDWSSIRFICSTCSLASVHRHEGGAGDPVWEAQRRVGLGAPRDQAERLLGGWSAAGEDRRAGAVSEVG